MSKSTSSKASKVTDEKREKVEADKRRQELRTLLITKFQTKYSDKSIPLSLIQEHIDRFLDTMPLTSENLQALDSQILEAVKPKPGTAQSSKSTHPQPKAKKQSKPALTGQKHVREEDDDKLSVMSGATDIVAKPKSKQVLDTKTRHVKGEEGEMIRPKSEQDEWAAIIKFNSSLYQEELKQEQLKKTHQKQFMKNELEKQMKEKMQIKERDKAEEEAYIEYQKRHIKEMEEQEKQKQADKKQQVLSEKASRDKQRKDDFVRKKMEEREDKKRDRELIDRMKEELELEKKADMDRKELEKVTIKKMMEESLKLKEEQKELTKKEREDDVKLQLQQKKLLDMQEAERASNLMKKDERNKKLLEAATKATGGKGMKGTVDVDDTRMKEQIQMLTVKQKQEEEKMKKYKKEKQLEVKSVLEKQVVERKEKKVVDKQQSQQQAVMWKKELDLHYEQEQKNAQKLKEVNKKHQDYLLQQMELGKKGKTSNVMSEKEFLLNKQLLEELQAKGGNVDPAEAAN